MPETFAFALVLVGTSALTVAGILLIVTALRRPTSRAEGSGLPLGAATGFLFEGRTLIDCTPRGAALLDTLRASGEGDDLARLTRHLAADFPTLDAVLADIPTRRHAALAAADGLPLDLTVEWLDGVLRLSLSDTVEEDGAIQLDRLSYRAMQQELSLLRQITESAPLLLWRETAEGGVTWANLAYLHRASEMLGGAGLAWPLPSLFGRDAGRRVCLAGTNGARPAWFDVVRITGEEGTLAYALPADEAQNAEKTRREFVQTLTKTFATLPIGLAIFDRTRRLQVFNPALTDLTGLEPEFLLSRPGMEGFLNRMRDKHVLPEPRDYRSWARRLLEIETSANAGQFEETWSLPTGQTFRVSANPHPDGALAFLIEDITAETHLTRNVRSEMDTSQSVLNQIDDAIAVFAPNGQLVLTNTAFSQLWTLEGEDSLAAVTLPEALENWREVSDNADLWTRIAALARPGQSDRTPIRERMRMIDGETLAVTARRTSTGALMISFAPDEVPLATSPRAQVLRASA